MRSAIVMADVLTDPAAAMAELQRLDSAGLHPVVLVTARASVGPTIDVGGYPVVAAPPGEIDGWDESVGLLARAAAPSGAVLHDIFLICRDPEAVTHGVAAGCRPVLVLDGRSLTDVFGPGEPPVKHIPVAADLATAVRYAVDETAQDDALGPFPYDPGLSFDRPVRAVGPSQRDLATIFGVVTIAGVAVALGIAYLLQEVYQTIHVPALFYWVTLQFIPQTWRGLLFLALGAALGFVAARILSRLSVSLRAARR